MQKITHTFACILLLLFATKVKSQLSGSYSIPGTYTSIAAAISDLNTYGVSGPVTMNIAAGYTETAIVGGYTLNAIVGASATSPVIFQKSGAGANPQIIAYTSGTNTPSSAVQDGVWRFIGTDYVTINGIDIMDPNTTNPATMEFGYCFFKASTTDGCQYNTIVNCVITLNRVNNAAGSGPAIDGSRGIGVVNALPGAHTTALTIINAGGANSYNKFYSNTIQNCNYGISLIGFADVSPFAFADTGNDIGGNSSATGNTIINYGGGGTTSPAAAVRTLAQYNLNVSYNIINNNNGSGVSHATVLRGIYLNTATSANATINSNTLTISNGGTNSQVSIIENASGSTAAGNTITINNNLITGCTSSVNTSGLFYGIYNSASAQNLSISGNNYTNNTSNSTSGTTYLLYNSGAVPGVITLANNNLSHTFNNSTTAYSGSMYNIYNGNGTTTSNLTIAGNTFSNYNFSPIIGSGSVYFIYNSTSCFTYSLSGNTWSNLSMNHNGSELLMYNLGSTQNLLTVTNNSIVTGFTRLAASGAMYCYYASSSSPGSCSQVFSGNNFSNITSTVSGLGTFYGFYNSDGSASPYPKKTVTNNILSNITYSTSGTFYGFYTGYVGDGSTTSGSSVYNNLVSGITTGGSIYGLYMSTPTSPNYPPSVYQNTVAGVTSLGAFSAIYGSYLSGGSPGMNFYKNKIYNLSENGTSGTAYGMYIIGGTNTNYYNNLVGSISTPSSSSTSAINGIYISSGTSLNFYYNTVYLNATTSSTASFGSNAIYASTSPNVNLRNNIFVNLSTAVGAGLTTAYRRSSTTLTTYSSTSNNNLFYAGPPTATNVIYYDGTTAYQTLASYKALLANRDLASVTENPSFISITGSTSNFLGISTGVPTQVESGGAPVAGISDDYPGTVRNTTFPDIGAWEGSYPTAGDLNPPVVVSAGFISSPCNTASRTYTASLGDVSGVASGTLAPRMYYKLNSGSYSSVAGTLSSGSATLGLWTFTMTYSASNNDVVSYYLVSQDISANLMASPIAGFAGTDVNTISTPPTTPLTYTVSGSLSGVYTIGSTGTYTSLTAAANAYNNSCLSGAVTFSLTDALYSSAETFPIVFQNNPFASASNSLLIRPAAGVTAAITSTGTATGAVLKFLDARYITVDGINSGGSSFAVNNAGTSSSANFWLASGTAAGSKYITIKNVTLTGGNNTTSSVYGINSSVDGINPGTSSGADNDNIIIQGNTLLNVYHGIYAVGAGAASAGGLDNWLITNNLIGPASLASNAIGGNGVYVSGAVNLTVTLNTMRNFTTTASSIGAIYFAANINGITVTQNTLTGIYSSGTGGSTTSNCGMFFGSNVTNGSIAFNIITTVVNNNPGEWGVRGMIFATSNALSNLKVNNNMISDISTIDCCGLTYSSVGIEIGSSTGGLDLDFNTINLFGTHSGLASTNAVLYISSANGNLRIRNNIFSNSYSSTGTTSDFCYAIYSSVANTNFTAMDNNDFYVGGPATTNLGYLGGALSTLSALQTAFGMNPNSVYLPAVFTATNDLHLSPSAAGNYFMDNLGAPLVGITTDIDGQTRSLTTPDIGADEFTATSVCSSASGGTISTSSYSLCSTQTISIASASVSGGANTVYQWQVSPTSGGSYTNVTAGTGPNTISYKTPLLPAGTYYYVLKTTCSGSLSGVSNEVTVSVNGLPTPTIISTPSVICGSGSATLTANGASSFTWNTGATSSSIVVTPTSSAFYNVTGGSPGCTTIVSPNFSLFYSLNPTVTATSASTVICSGIPATLTASGANTYSWSNGATGALVNPTPSVTTTYTVTGYKPNGCNSSVTQSIAVNPSPTISISGSSGICTGQTASLTASGAVTYSWNTGATSASIASTPTTNTTYTVTGTDGLGCSTTKTQLVTVAASLSISIVGPSTICLGQAANLAGNGGVTYTWSTGSTNATIAPTPTANTTYSIIGASGTCSNTAVTTITVNANPVISVSGNSVICVGQTTSLTAAGAFTYTWSTTQTGAAIAVSPTVNSTYSVTGTSSVGCPASATTAVVSNSLPVISIAPSASVVCSLSQATLASTGANTYTWSGGSTGSTVVVTPTVNSTTYTVTGTNGFGCISSATIALATYSLPVIIVAPPTTTVCSLTQASFTASGATTYTWNNATVNAVLSVTPATSTVYTVTGTSSSGCNSTFTAGVITNTLPVMAISPASATVCSQSATSLTASGATSYSWSSGGFNASTTVYPVNNTTYTVTGQNTFGCVSAATVAVSTLSLPAVAITPSITTVCVLAPATFTASGAVTYTWNNSSVTGSTAVFTSTATVTSYSVKGKGANGCLAGAQLIVFTNPLPVLTISASSPTVCSLAPVSFTAAGANTYTWSNNQTGDSIVVTPVSTSIYTVQGTNALTGCVGNQTVAVSTHSLPTLSIIPASPTVCAKSQLTLTASGGASYLWSNGSANTSIHITPTLSTTYTLTGVDSLGCQNVKTVTVTTNALPVIAVALSHSTICASETATLTASGASTYSWLAGNATGAVFVTSPSVTTVYTVTGVDNYSCSNKTTVILLVNACTGIKTNGFGTNAVSVFPNPSTGVFTAKFEFEGEKTVQIINSVGQLMQQTVTGNMSEVFDISDLAKGIYFVKVSAKQASGNYKIVIE